MHDFFVGEGFILGSWIGIFLSANKGDEKYNPRGFSPRCFSSQTTALVYSPQLVLLIQQGLATRTETLPVSLGQTQAQE